MSGKSLERNLDLGPVFNIDSILDAIPGSGVSDCANACSGFEDNVEGNSELTRNNDTTTSLDCLTSTTSMLVKYVGGPMRITRWLWRGPKECGICKRFPHTRYRHYSGVVFISPLAISLDVAFDLNVLMFLIGETSTRVLLKELHDLFLRYRMWQAVNYDTNRMVIVMGSRKLAQILPEDVLKARLDRCDRRYQNGIGAIPLQSPFLECMNQNAKSNSKVQPLPSSHLSQPGSLENHRPPSPTGSASSPHQSSLPMNSADFGPHISIRVFNKESQIRELDALLDTGCRLKPVDDSQSIIAGIISEDIAKFLQLDISPLVGYTFTDFEGRSSNQPLGLMEVSWQIVCERYDCWRINTFAVARQLASDVIISMAGVEAAGVLRWNRDQIRFQAPQNSTGSVDRHAGVDQTEAKKKVSFRLKWASGSLRWHGRRTSYKKPQ